jgi:hypothetical protein
MATIPGFAASISACISFTVPSFSLRNTPDTVFLKYICTRRTRWREGSQNVIGVPDWY